MAPSRLAANAVVDDATPLKRTENSRLARKIGRKAMVTPTRNRGTGDRSSSRSPGTPHARASEASNATYSHTGRGIRTRRATSTAARTLSSTPVNTAAFTAHVVPKSRANCTTFLVSSSRNATPMKNRSV